MRAARLHGFDSAGSGVRVEEVADPEAGPGEILLEMLAAPVNPADLNVIEGKYGTLPPLPAVLGNEGVGRAVTGPAGFAPGDLILPMQRGTWCGRMTVSAAGAVKLPPGLDPFQAAMLSVNPVTAWAMLHEFVSLQPGEWIVQNAANSGVGRCVIQLGKLLGLRTLNVVRRPELVEELTAWGADAVVTEDCDLRERIGELCGGARPQLALNGVGGSSALNLANALGDEGRLVTYGAMGRQPLKIPNGLLIFRGLRFEGFWLTRWLAGTDREKRGAVMQELAQHVLSGRLRQPIGDIVPLSEVARAVSLAGGEKRSGKVLLDLTR